MDLHDLYGDIVREHSMSGHNLRHLEHPSVVVPGRNPSCGDEIDLELSVEGDRIKDGSFTGVGCAISRASVSIMLDLVRGRTLDEAAELARLFLAMEQREPLTDRQLDALEEAVALKGVSNMPARVKCATMPWHTLLNAVEVARGTD
ncbi:MAG: Fe-S cluster assembly sulfur transfer protein SufU [Sphaerochaetaceae bacterium]|jgi:nitrogen fixation NifU-like protein